MVSEITLKDFSMVMVVLDNIIIFCIVGRYPKSTASDGQWRKL